MGLGPLPRTGSSPPGASAPYDGIGKGPCQVQVCARVLPITLSALTLTNSPRVCIMIQILAKICIIEDLSAMHGVPSGPVYNGWR